MGTGIALPTTHPYPHHPGYTSPPGYTSAGWTGMTGWCSGHAGQRNMVVGLRSVAQLSLDARFSGFRGMTEVYNLCTAGNPNDHYCIPGNE